jgi:hypothetical protein
VTIGRERLQEIAAQLAGRPGHEKVRALIHELLVHGLGASSSEIDFERPLPEVRGRVDALLGQTIFEFKRDLRQEHQDAEGELTRYLTDRERKTGLRFVGIATDGAEFRPYELRRGRLARLPSFTLTKDRGEELLAWLDAAVSVRPDLDPTPETVRRELGRESLAYERAGRVGGAPGGGEGTAGRGPPPAALGGSPRPGVRHERRPRRPLLPAGGLEDPPFPDDGRRKGGRKMPPGLELGAAPKDHVNRDRDPLRPRHASRERRYRDPVGRSTRTRRSSSLSGSASPQAREPKGTICDGRSAATNRSTISRRSGSARIDLRRDNVRRRRPAAGHPAARVATLCGIRPGLLPSIEGAQEDYRVEPRLARRPRLPAAW